MFILNPAVKRSFSSVLFIHTLLNHFKISSDQEAFDNFDDFIYSVNLNKPVENNQEKINQFTKCNDNNEFSTFINCLNLFFRNWQIYENSNVHEKVILEQIIGFSLILNNQKQINVDVIFSLDEGYDGGYKFKYGTTYEPEYIAFKDILSSDKTFFLKSSDDGYFFLEKLMNFYSSDEYKNLINIDQKENLKWMKEKITKYENSSLLDKLDYYWIENPNVQTGLRYAEAAITIYVAYEFLNTLSNTNFSNIDDLISSKKSGNANTSTSNLKRGTLIKPYGKGKSQSGLFMSHPDNSNVGLFQVTKPGNYMYSNWIPAFKIGFF